MIPVTGSSGESVERVSLKPPWVAAYKALVSCLIVAAFFSLFLWACVQPLAKEVLLLWCLAICFGNTTVVMLLCAKVFFSSHSIEYRPIEEITTLRQGLGFEEEDSVDLATEQGRAVADELFSGVDEDYTTLTDFENALRRIKTDEDGDKH